MRGPRRSGFYLGELLFLLLAAFFAGVSGLALTYLRFFLPADPFSPVPEGFPFWQHLHVLFVPAMAVALGLAWARHAHSFWQGKRGRKLTGLLLLWLGALMIFSGVAYQVSVAEEVRSFWRLLHTASSLFWLGCLLVHLLRPKSANGR